MTKGRTLKIAVSVLLLSLGEVGPVPAAEALETKYAPMAINIKQTRSARAASIGVVEGGKPLRVGYRKGNWYAVFAPGAERPKASEAIGYVYAPLLKDRPADKARAAHDW